MKIQHMIDYLKCQFEWKNGDCNYCSLYNGKNEPCVESYDIMLKLVVNILEQINNCNEKSATECFEVINKIKEKYK